MKTFWKICSTVLLSLSLFLVSSAHAADKKVETYSMVVFLKGSEFFNWAYAGMQDAAKMLGDNVKVELQGPAEWDASVEARTVTQLTARKVDGIVLTAGEAKTLEPAINRAIEYKIPVITFDSDSPTSNRLTFVGTNNYQAGYAAGQEMAQWVKGGGAVGVSYMKGPAHLAARVQGFTDALNKASPNTKIYEVDDQGSIEGAASKITALIQAHSDIKAIFAAHGNPTTGAAQAIRDLNLRGKIVIMGFDFDEATVALIDNGEVQAIVGQNPYLMGFQGLLQAYAARHPTRVGADNANFGWVPKTIDTGVRLIYKKDLESIRKVPSIN
ncbi:substrate-binding domain-containing protein [Sodalis sp. RH22]|uniref:substrate-binding domain-containing protein n=1 Tax=unclassified Sodalis (in: enterobacteria) TaxID=2636512 RepID=UPI0039B690B0